MIPRPAKMVFGNRPGNRGGRHSATSPAPVQAVEVVKMDIPKSLKTQGRKFYQKVLVECADLREIHDLERLKMAGKCLDDIAEAEKQIKKDGRYVLDRYNQTKEHCAQKTIRENRIIFCRIIRELGLDLEVPEPRPPRQY